MIIHKIVLGPYQENCYVIVHEASREALVIDPGDEAQALIETFQREDIRPVRILLTHGHVDHVGAVDALRNAFAVPVHLSEVDMEYVRRGAPAFGTMEEPDAWLTEGEEIEFHGETLRVMNTPGHSKGSVSFLMGAHLFSGDVLFQGSIGRTDLPGGDYDELIDTIRSRFLILDPKIRVYPGHGPETILDREARMNPFLRR